MLLDTCALLWLAQGESKFTKPTMRKISEAPVLYISSISCFEVGVKWTRGKLSLPMRPSEWFRAVLEHHGIAEIPLSGEICFAATELPLIHNDPCDRFIIATAKVLRLPIVTADQHFASYGVEVFI